MESFLLRKLKLWLLYHESAWSIFGSALLSRMREGKSGEPTFLVMPSVVLPEAQNYI